MAANSVLLERVAGRRTPRGAARGRLTACLRPAFPERPQVVYNRWLETSPLGRSIAMDKELTDRAELIQKRILQLKDSL